MIYAMPSGPMSPEVGWILLGFLAVVVIGAIAG